MAEVDYKELYRILSHAAEQAIRVLQTEQNLYKAEYLLITAQQKCEHLYFSQAEE